MRPGSQKWYLTALFGIVFLIAVSLGWLAAKRSAEIPPPAAEEIPVAVDAKSKVAAHIYFGDRQGRFLTAEQRVFDAPSDDLAFGRQLVQALIEGPRKQGSRTLPETAQLRAVYLFSDRAGENGTAVVDFDAQAFTTHPGGVNAELLSIYSIVNTLVFNVDGVRSVKILIGGREAATLAGHVDLSHPFAADMLWVR